jgi:hypothetical protein
LGSSGGDTVTVPNVVGATRSSAESTIQNYGLEVGTVTQQSSNTVAAGRVISQSPGAGNQVSLGTRVSLVISTGAQTPETTTVPDLRGKTQSNAESDLFDAGLVLGNVTQANSSTVPEGRVISHTPAAGASVQLGSAVNIVLSSGADAIRIDDISELQKIGNDPAYPINGNYELAGNISASVTASWNGGLGFAPIGTTTKKFTGRFDGRGFTISGLTINRPSEDYVGLFGYVGENTRIENVSINGGTVTGDDYVGSLCGYADGATINQSDTSASVAGDETVGCLVGFSKGLLDSCFSDGFTSGRTRVGGLVGKSMGAITNSSASGPTTGSSSYTGGLAGVNEDGTVVSCSNIGEVNSHSIAGGLIGWNDGTISTCWTNCDVSAPYGDVGGLVGHNRGTITQSLAEGDVQGGSFDVGGLVGESVNGSINQSYALGAVSGNKAVGGLVGDASRGTILHCYASGAVTASSIPGGLVGAGTPVATSSFWDIQTSGATESAGGEGLTTVQMKTRQNFKAAGWDFVSTWGINEGTSYPYLLWTTSL